MKEKTQVNTARRNLLKGITTATVAGAVAAGTSKVASAAEVSAPEEIKETGYHETQHIRDYYDTL